MPTLARSTTAAALRRPQWKSTRTAGTIATAALLLLGSACGTEPATPPAEQEPSSISKLVDAQPAILQTGTVNQFNEDRGFGFITLDDGGASVFVHHSAIQGSWPRTLEVGARVQFVLFDDPKGPRAQSVSLAD